MSRRWGIFNYIFTVAVTIGAILLIIALSNERRGNVDAFGVIGLLVLGGCIAGLVTTFLHETGHALFAKRNDFYVLSYTVAFFSWVREKGKFVFHFSLPLDEFGSVEFVPKHSENIEKRFKRTTAGGLIFTAFSIVLGVIPFIIIDKLPFSLFIIWSMFLPVGLYCFFENAIPTINGGFANDGGTIYQLNKNTDSIKVVVSILKIQAELYQGKTYAEIDESLYFDVPQLIEDDLNFTLILNARYNYYLDKKDYDNAKKTTDRLLTLIDYMPKSFEYVVKADALYNACTFDRDENLADDLTYELEKYLNKVNTATNLRIKLAYILNIRQESDKVELFYKKGIKEASKCQIKGQTLFEKKLLKELKGAFDTENKTTETK